MGVETFGERLKRLRGLRGLSQRKLATAAGLTNGTISQAEAGKLYVDQLPSHDLLRRLAVPLAVDVEVLAGDRDLPVSTRPAWLDESLDDLLLRLGAELVQDIEFDMTASAGTGRRKPKSNRIKPRKPHYVIEVEGDCMVPDIQNGDTVHFDPTLDPENGDWVIATINGENAIVKKLVVKGGISQQLLPLNGEPLTIDENVRILGVVISYERPGPRGRRKQA